MEFPRGVFALLLIGVSFLANSALRISPRTEENASQDLSATWNFVVSGDSRNCGNVVMPAIAGSARQNHAKFYWHLGDLRMIQRPDEDYLHEPEHRSEAKNELVLVADYEKNAWRDFIHEQVLPFQGITFFIGIGNHEVITPKTRGEFIETFSPWLDQPVLRNQRIADDPGATTPWTFFHWKQSEVDFIYLDNASREQFTNEQLRWLEGVLRRDEDDPAITTLVVGMHESLPDSLADEHSMSDSETGKRTGRQVYADLARVKAKGKKVYVLASHSHFYMDGIFNTEALHDRGEVLPGWIIGTAGAYRYKLPSDASQAFEAEEGIYGYLVGTVSRDGDIRFIFKKIQESDISEETMKRYTPGFVHWCFAHNRE